MLTMCRAVALAVSRAHDAGADDAPDNAPHDPARDAKPSGKLRCKNAGTNVHAGLGNVRNNPAVHTVALNHLPSRMLGAGPRATTPPQLTPFAARADAADTAAPAHAAAPDLGRSRDTAGLTADGASVEPIAGNLRCNNVFADAAARTAVRIPSADNAGADDGSRLAARRCDRQNDSGPREPITPAVQVSKRSANFASRRFLHLAPHRLSFVVRPAPIPRPTARALARFTARFCHAFKALLTRSTA